MALTLVLVVVAAVLLIRPFAAATPATTGEWMTQHRQGEIQVGLSGAPAADIQIFRAGEIGAGQVSPLLKSTGQIGIPSGFTGTYNPLAPVERSPLTHATGLAAAPTGFTATYNPLSP